MDKGADWLDALNGWAGAAFAWLARLVAPVLFLLIGLGASAIAWLLFD